MNADVSINDASFILKLVFVPVLYFSLVYTIAVVSRPRFLPETIKEGKCNLVVVPPGNIIMYKL